MIKVEYEYHKLKPWKTICKEFYVEKHWHPDYHTVVVDNQRLTVNNKMKSYFGDEINHKFIRVKSDPSKATKYTHLCEEDSFYYNEDWFEPKNYLDSELFEI